MSSQYSEQADGVVRVSTVAADNLGESTSAQRETMAAMNRMYKTLPAAERKEMKTLYSLAPDDAKSALTDIGASRAGEMMNLVQTNTLAAHVVSDRLNTAFSLQPVNVPVGGNKLEDDGKDYGVEVPVNLPVEEENGAWVKFTKNWGDLQGGANYHGNAISGGYRKGARDAYWYADYGWQRNKMRRGIAALGLSPTADYRSYIVEVGGEYKYDLHAEDGKVWHVSPYANMQLSYMHQNDCQEQGAGVCVLPCRRAQNLL